MHFARLYIDLKAETQRRQRSFQPEGVTQEESGRGRGSPLVRERGCRGVERERERKRKKEGREREKEVVSERARESEVEGRLAFRKADFSAL